MKSSTLAGPGCAYGVLGLFAVFGLVFAGFGLMPLLELRQAQSWTPTPCTILTSGVAEEHGSDGSTYRVEVTFRYEVAGVEHVSERYRVSRISSSGHAGKQRIVDTLPPGTDSTCFVNPEDPSEAILRRDWGGEWIFVAAGLGFSALGVVLALFVWRRARRPAAAPTELDAGGRQLDLPVHSASTQAMRAATADGGPLQLVSGSRRGAKVVFMAVFTVFWNGISWPLLGPHLLRLLSGDMEALLPGLVAPVFLLVGLGTLAYLVYLVLAWFNPRPKLVLSTGLLRPGTQAEVTWQIQGARARLEDLTVRLEGRRVSTMGSGEHERTRSHAFRTVEVAETGRASRIMDGKATVEVPADAEPSQEQARRATRWVLVVQGTIRGWPDLRVEFVLWVHPRGEAS